MSLTKQFSSYFIARNSVEIGFIGHLLLLCSEYKVISCMHAQSTLINSQIGCSCHIPQLYSRVTFSKLGQTYFSERFLVV
jgi:hypothetical protein